MPNPRPLTESELQSLWAEVRAEFPDDEMMQEIHFVRALHAVQLQDFTREERRAYFNRFVPRTASQTA